MRLGILVSGRGSNLAAVLDAIAAGRLPGVEPAVVISNRAGVPALDIAARHGVPVRLVPRTAYPDAGTRDAAIAAALAEHGCHLALLAGYDQVLRPPYFAAFAGPTINIHPSLLPRHGGRGMVGLAVHEAVLAAGERETGVTIHGVTPDLDAGPVIAQVRVPVRNGDDPETLARRVLRVEHRVLVETLARLAREGLAAEPSASMTAASGAKHAPAVEH